MINEVERRLEGSGEGVVQGGMLDVIVIGTFSDSHLPSLGV